MPITLTDDVRSVLERSTITADSLTLPPEQLDRKLYEAVNKVLVAAGGKWNRKAKAHIFESDPRQRLELALASSRITSEKQELQAFYTPAAVAARVVKLACVSGCTVLEPSAGAGALAKECKAQGARSVDAVEINRDCAKHLVQACDNFVIRDFLSLTPEPYYDRVVMNPPFTKNQDIDHVRHAIQFVRPGGRLVAIMAGNAERKSFTAMTDDMGDDEVTISMLPDGSFKEAGTSARTLLIIIHKKNLKS
ncbi:class I SAM-dependent methyltransferase [Ruficoccus sp. ZRK36]|uniref:methyltransferase n=1 Tax=Ruficoccus sp. ZRK36 TaxID=2866311 RepID=UPI001C73CA3B|nr:class I SAM-dependent methyltransferase [Ruficoccus sp. ZRK36]QYY35288.1 class I SAM-dependent methyltransferase [Ruficoccus sp. ZRK36]